MADYTYRTITLEDMKNYIDTNAPQDKAWFKAAALNAKGVYDRATAVREFQKRYQLPELMPKKKGCTAALANW